MNSGRLIGIVAIVFAFGIAAVGGLWLAAATESLGGALLGAFILFIPVALIAGFGIFMVVKGARDSIRQSEMVRQRKLLDIIQSRGQVQVHSLALEMGIPVEDVKQLVHQLVGLQVFSGYVNWDNGTLYSSEASQLRDLSACRNCGGEIDLTGKGIAVCKFCGTEYFLN